ncbi:MAG TPA: NADH-quinone oxidoreductase subunit NuoG [Candidatus Binatia bacterium]|nr:NADH-quinone oxidoreductase subunit NuoG [Candidatus Binatia bacterium]
MSKDVTVTIDGVSVTVPEGTLLVEAAKKVDHEIPVYCYHPKLGPAGLCRICLVEIEKMPKLQIACNTPVTDGMVVHTSSKNATEGRRAVLEFLLLNHPLDCPICDKGGECDLQDYVMAYGQGASRLADAKMHKPKAVDLGPTIVLDEERCILCLRCVRFDEIVTNEHSLRTEDRGAHAIIATATGEAYRSSFTGNVTELCPVGALTSKTYRFKSRPWDLHRTPTSCLQCSVGCRLNIDERHGEVLRTMSDPDDAISDGWLCDRGRYNIGFYHDERRITTPLLRTGEQWVQISWDEAIEQWAASLKESAAADGPQSIGVLGGGRLLNEEAFLLRHLCDALGVKNVDWRTGRQRFASHAARNSLAELENAGVIVTYGRPPSQMAPILDLRIRKAVSHNGARLISFGELGADAFVAEKHANTLDELRAALPAQYERIAFVSDGVSRPLDAALAGLRDELAAAGKQIVSYVLGEQPNARGADALGLVPSGGGLDARGMLEAARDGKLRTLAIFGANPMLRFPDRALVEAALARVPFTIVSELFMTQTAERANVILPARGPFEKTGTTTNVAGEILDIRAGLHAPEGTLADGEMFAVLADALGIALPDVHAIRLAIESAVGNGLQRDEAQPPKPRASTMGLIIRHIEHIFSGGGTSAFDAHIAALRPGPALLVARGEAGLEDGDVVDVVAVDGTRLDKLTVRTGNRIARGNVFVIDGLPEAPANLFADGAAVSIENVRKVREPVEA